MVGAVPQGQVVPCVEPSTITHFLAPYVQATINKDHHTMSKAIKAIKSIDICEYLLSPCYRAYQILYRAYQIL
jgi:hypothetical protein